MTDHRGRGKVWLATTLAGTLIIASAGTAALPINRAGRPTSADCRIVVELVQHWRSAVQQAGSIPERSFGGDAQLRAAVEARYAAATKIRGRIRHVHSPAIAADLSLWAAGIEKMARAQHSAVTDPPVDAAPEDYLQGALDSYRAGKGFMTVCQPAAGTPAFGEVVPNSP